MKQITFLISCFSFLILFTSCEKESLLPANDDRVPVTFTSNITAAPQTRTDGNNWVGNDLVGIFTRGYKDVDNFRYIVKAREDHNEIGDLQPAGTDTLFYPQSGTVDIIAYYPYNSSTTLGVHTVDVSVQTNPGAIDLLRADTTGVGKPSSPTPIPLRFKHRLSKLTLTVKRGAGLTDVDFTSGITAKIGGMPTTVQFDLSDGTFSNHGISSSFDMLVKDKTISEALFEAILIPQGANVSGRSVIFTVNSMTYFWAIDDTVAFAQGDNHNYTLTLNGTGITIESNSITKWTTNNHGSQTAPELP
jgi:hypothetical protein